MLLLASAFECDRNQFLAANARIDQSTDRLLARRIEMADGIEADDALRTKAPVEQVAGDFTQRSWLWRLVPAEMPVHQLIGLEHAVAFGNRDSALIECELQRPL